MPAPDDEFRAELRAWLAHHPPPPVEVASTRADADALRAWQRAMHADRWVGIHWPVEYGGRGASVTQVAIYNEELARAGAPPLLGRAGITLVGPTLIAHGTEEQRTRWMPRILAGDDVWCQLFSEPGAGSDLAALSTRAQKSGGVYRVNGQKVWSSYATFADMGIALVRTDPDAPAHKGISMLAIPMDAKGVDVRPLRQMTGDYEFNEVFFDDVDGPGREPHRPGTRRVARGEHDARQRAGRVVHLEGASAARGCDRAADEGMSRGAAAARSAGASAARAVLDRRRDLPPAQRAHAGTSRSRRRRSAPSRAS